MGRKVFTVTDQIEQLKQRGLVINDDIKAEEILLDIGYYRLGFYWYYFQNEKKGHQFEPNISLDDIVDLYYFDFDLKCLLARYIYRIEVHFRTQVVYIVSNYYPNDITWYTDSAKVNNHILKDLNTIYYTLGQNTNILKKHHIKYPADTHAPTWKTFEFLTFGQIYKIYSNLKESHLKESITNVYGFRDYKLLDNYFRAIINIRNICSHNAVLYDFNQPIGIRRIPNKYYRNKTHNNTNMNASIRLILFILSKISKNRAQDLERDLHDLFKGIQRNPKISKIISEKIMFDL
ncbi:MAG: Abi family protein [Bacteroidetes bacterium]|nr:Abi family protein [Bacteroidota bacterium]